MLQIEIEYLMEAQGNVKPYAGESMVPGRGYWFGVYWRVLGDKYGLPSFAKNCLTHKEALDYIKSLKEGGGHSGMRKLWTIRRNGLDDCL